MVGLKPTYGSISRYGLIAYASSLDTPGVMCHSVRDAELLFTIMRGRDVKDATSLGESGVLPTMDAIKSGNEEEAAQLSGGKAWHSLKDRIKGLTIGIPREFCVEEMSPSVTSAWSRAIEWLQDCGADVRNVSLPSTKHALAAYYIIAPAEAASNLARYDGIRYGFRQDGGNAAGEGSSSDASALHEEMTATRSSGFGEEVQVRLRCCCKNQVEEASMLYLLFPATCS